MIHYCLDDPDLASTYNFPIMHDVGASAWRSDCTNGAMDRQDRRADPGRRELRAHETATKSALQKATDRDNPGHPQEWMDSGFKKGQG
jgi:hypothetical protein